MNIVTNSILNENITCDDRDTTWMNSFIKNLIQANDNFYKKFVCKSNNMYHFNHVNYLNQSIQVAKQNYVNKFAHKLGDPNTSSKYYWSLLKTLLNGNKIPCIPPLFHGDKYYLLLTFKEKVRFSNVLQFQMGAFYLLNYHCGLITHYLFVTLQKMTFLE